MEDLGRLFKILASKQCVPSKLAWVLFGTGYVELRQREMVAKIKGCFKYTILLYKVW